MRIEDLREDPRRLNHVTVDPDLCMGCKKCLHTCCYDVYKWDSEKKVSVAAYEEECVTSVSYTHLTLPTNSRV